MTTTPADRAIGRRYRSGLLSMLRFAGDEAPLNSQPLLIDEAFDAYLLSGCDRPRTRTIAQGDQALANGFRRLRA
jgi:hypothetical protein